jgi:hypothetical protein
MHPFRAAEIPRFHGTFRRPKKSSKNMDWGVFLDSLLMNLCNL